MVPMILIVLGLVVVVIGVLALLAVIHIGVVWWVLLLVGAGLILLGWYLRRGTPVVRGGDMFVTPYSGTTNRLNLIS